MKVTTATNATTTTKKQGDYSRPLPNPSQTGWHTGAKVNTEWFFKSYFASFEMVDIKRDAIYRIAKVYLQFQQWNLYYIDQVWHTQWENAKTEWNSCTVTRVGARTRINEGGKIQREVWRNNTRTPINHQQQQPWQQKCLQCHAYRSFICPSSLFLHTRPCTPNTHAEGEKKE